MRQALEQQQVQAIVGAKRRELCMGRVLLTIDFAVAAEQ